MHLDILRKEKKRKMHHLSSESHTQIDFDQPLLLAQQSIWLQLGDIRIAKNFWLSWLQSRKKCIKAGRKPFSLDDVSLTQSSSHFIKSKNTNVTKNGPVFVSTYYQVAGVCMSKWSQMAHFVARECLEKSWTKGISKETHPSPCSTPSLSGWSARAMVVGLLLLVVEKYCKTAEGLSIQHQHPGHHWCGRSLIKPVRAFCVCTSSPHVGCASLALLWMRGSLLLLPSTPHRARARAGFAHPRTVSLTLQWGTL